MYHTVIKVFLHPKNPVESRQTIEIRGVKPHLTYSHVTTSCSSDQQQQSPLQRLNVSRKPWQAIKQNKDTPLTYPPKKSSIKLKIQMRASNLLTTHIQNQYQSNGKKEMLLLRKQGKIYISFRLHIN